MKPHPRIPRGRRARRARLGVFVVPALFAILLTACGISFGAGTEETEMFKQLTVEGDFRPSGPLTMTLEYARQYKVHVNVKCELLDLDPEPTVTPEVSPTATSTPVEGLTPTPAAIPRRRPTPTNKVQDLLEFVVRSNPEGGPVGEATPVPGSAEHNFPAPGRPGRYVVRCFTTDDENNVIFEDFTVAPATPTPLPTPTP